jgi:hypothetical protein
MPLITCLDVHASRTDPFDVHCTVVVCWHRLRTCMTAQPVMPALSLELVLPLVEAMNITASEAGRCVTPPSRCREGGLSCPPPSVTAVQDRLLQYVAMATLMTHHGMRSVHTGAVHKQ